MAKVVKKNKILYYLQSYLRLFSPSTTYKNEILRLKKRLNNDDIISAEERVKYYCKSKVEGFSQKIKDLRKPQTPKTYYHDTYEYAKFFNENQAINYVFGDVVHVPDKPSIVKSRPVIDNNNSVLLNLDKVRHFVWIKNDKPFTSKKNLLLGRAAVYQQHRYDFFQSYFNHPLCDLGQVNQAGGNLEWFKNKMSLQEHLDYKFILCLQGNDVATNLKWVMSSNSIAVMPKPTLETWFMEGKLVGGKHYIEILPDYSDLEEKLIFYVNNEEKCLGIIKNAHKHCEQFFNSDIEKYCSLRVLEEYFGD